MTGDRASEIIKEGEPEAILSMAAGAWLAAEKGRYCECDEPSLHGLDLMCGNCLLENEGQIEKRMRAMRAPHPFNGGPLGTDALCRLCAGWPDDPRHKVPA